MFLVLSNFSSKKKTEGIKSLEQKTESGALKKY